VQRINEETRLNIVPGIMPAGYSRSRYAHC
jgi:hypothetical protein